MKYTIKHLKYYLEGKHSLIPKSLGVELVELGILNYKKLTAENYNYWWYEASDLTKFDKNNYTYNWNDLIPTRKINLVKAFINYHNENESMYKLITSILNIESAYYDGIDKKTGEFEFVRQINFYYKDAERQEAQMKLEFN